ncbi:MAG: hypothetical protein QGG40_16750 [Myxococcota bacterium]|nr:hypothetical protein [Myxococcota bacterium]
MGASPGRHPRTRATLNHPHWPDGIADRGGRDHEPDMLDFLGRYTSE